MFSESHGISVFEQLCLWQATKIVTSSQANLSFLKKACVKAGAFKLSIF